MDHLSNVCNGFRLPLWSIQRGFTPGFAKKGALDSQLQVIKLTSCLPMVGGSLRVLKLFFDLNLLCGLNGLI
jgi:hypothetical protein